MTAPDFTIADKLREARALVERGWTRGSFVAGITLKAAIATGADCRVCALGAIGIAEGRVPSADDATVILLAKAVGVNTRQAALDIENDIATWNDEQASKRPVLAAFDRAIELASPSQ